MVGGHVLSLLSTVPIRLYGQQPNRDSFFPFASLRVALPRESPSLLFFLQPFALGPPHHHDNSLSSPLGCIKRISRLSLSVSLQCFLIDKHALSKILLRVQAQPSRYRHYPSPWLPPQVLLPKTQSRSDVAFNLQLRATLHLRDIVRRASIMIMTTMAPALVSPTTTTPRLHTLLPRRWRIKFSRRYLASACVSASLSPRDTRLRQ